MLSLVTLWTDNSQIQSVTNDNNHSTTYLYDTANRVDAVTDAKANTVTYTYDGNNNRVAVLDRKVRPRQLRPVVHHGLRVRWAQP